LPQQQWTGSRFREILSVLDFSVVKNYPARGEA